MQPTRSTELYVVKRNGQQQKVSFDKVLQRICKLCKDERMVPLQIDGTHVAQKVCAQIYPGVTTTELDVLASQLCSSMSTLDPEYGDLAKRIAVSNHHKNTSDSFADVMDALYNTHAHNGDHVPLISDELQSVVHSNREKIQHEIDYQRDYQLDFFGFKTLEKSYLLRLQTKEIVERPQHLWMRVAIGLYGENLESAFRCYHELSQKCYTHATPTLVNSGTPQAQLASCFLLSMQDDSIRGIFDTLGQCAAISKHAGGIGLNVHNIRCSGSLIRGTNGTSNGLVPMLRVFNDTARYVDQGGGKRNGSFAVYLEPWHPDIIDFLHLKRNHGDEQARARDLFYALWIPDLFMERVHSDDDWTLFDPDRAPGLDAVHGEAFDSLYRQYESDGRGHSTVKARLIWTTAMESMVETGTPYIMFKDACNRKSNQQNLGTIKSSNLCTEIVQFSSKDETAVCNLASVCLPSCVSALPDWAGKAIQIHVKKDCVFCGLALARLARMGCRQIKIHVSDNTSDTTWFKQAFAAFATADGAVTFPQLTVDGVPIGGFDGLVEQSRQAFDFDLLGQLTRSLVRNLNQTIDRTFYPTPHAERSNLRHRPIGIGVQGLADVFHVMRYPFDSPQATELNKQIFATMYYHAMSESMLVAKERALLADAVLRYFKSVGNLIALQRDDWWNAHEVFVDAATRAHARALLAELTPRSAEANAFEAHPFRTAFPGAYSSFAGSPLHKGNFQFDLWDADGGHDMHDWASLKSEVCQWGTRNSLLIAPMPTASTAQIMGNTECFETITSNIYLRRTLAGEFVVVNKHLMRDLIDMGIWTSALKDDLIFREGSLRDVPNVPDSIKELYKIVWDMSQKVVLDMAADRGRYICQSQSMNLFLASPSLNQIQSMLYYAWTKGLKTGAYYLRSKPASKAQQFTIDPTKFAQQEQQQQQQQPSTYEPCFSCSA
jgi:ribonucleoside-diphosphate reductase alpha subunit